MRVVALAGGVGGARLSAGLQLVLGDGELTVVVNTADDFDLHGLRISPDHDTVMYTLAGLADRERGWGLAEETWNTHQQLERYGGETWFRLGDRDLATHLVRTDRLRAGERATTVALALQRALDVVTPILPMTDADVRTQLRTQDGWLEFQDYFVRRRQEPAVLEVAIDGLDAARPTDEVRAALRAAEIVVICPSNPIVSIGPILALVRDELRGRPVVAVSPIVGGRALRGPADRMLASLGYEATALGVARLYADVAGWFVIDSVDAELRPAIEALGLRVHVTATVMSDDASRARLAREVVDLPASVTEPAMGAQR